MIIGIDTSCNKQYSCIVFSSEHELNELYKKLEQTIKLKCNWEIPLHWRKMSKFTRNCIYKNVFHFFQDTKIKFFIFEHKKQMGVSKEEYYLKTLPNYFSFILERLLRNTFGILDIECDKDYEVKGKETETTNTFLKNFINSISFRLTGKIHPISGKENFFHTDLMNNKTLLSIAGKIVSSQNSKSVQLADLILGLYSLKPLETRKIISYYKI